MVSAVNKFCTGRRCGALDPRDKPEDDICGGLGRRSPNRRIRVGCNSGSVLHRFPVQPNNGAIRLAPIAPYKVPRHVVFGEVPKTSTGKIQKFVLRERAKGM